MNCSDFCIVLLLRLNSILVTVRVWGNLREGSHTATSLCKIPLPPPVWVRHSLYSCLSFIPIAHLPRDPNDYLHPATQGNPPGNDHFNSEVRAISTVAVSVVPLCGGPGEGVLQQVLWQVLGPGTRICLPWKDRKIPAVVRELSLPLLLIHVSVFF